MSSLPLSNNGASRYEIPRNIEKPTSFSYSTNYNRKHTGWLELWHIKAVKFHQS